MHHSLGVLIRYLQIEQLLSFFEVVWQIGSLILVAKTQLSSFPLNMSLHVLQQFLSLWQKCLLIFCELVNQVVSAASVVGARPTGSFARSRPHLSLLRFLQLIFQSELLSLVGWFDGLQLCDVDFFGKCMTFHQLLDLIGQLMELFFKLRNDVWTDVVQVGVLWVVESFEEVQNGREVFSAILVWVVFEIDCAF